MPDCVINLSGPAGEFVEQQVASGKYASASDYVAHLINQARRDAARERLSDLILEGENSGEGTEFTDAWWDEKMAALRGEAERRQSA
jgi:antitoxin ParD1/3/4